MDGTFGTNRSLSDTHLGPLTGATPGIDLIKRVPYSDPGNGSGPDSTGAGPSPARSQLSR